MNPERVALFDMDGTLCGYDHVMRHDMDVLSSDCEPAWKHSDLRELHDLENEDTGLKARMDLIKRTPGWWRNLPRLEGGFEIMRLCDRIGFQIHVLTKGPASCGNAWTEKFEWFQQHVKSEFPDALLTITHDKGLVYGRVLVDDYPPYIERWLTWRPRGLVLMPEQRWNAKFEHPQVIRVHHNALGLWPMRLNETLKTAYDR